MSVSVMKGTMRLGHSSNGSDYEVKVGGATIVTEHVVARDGARRKRSH